mgnify:CR=1 FL=1
MSSAPTDTHKTFLADLARLVGPSHLLTDPAKTQRYRKGFRSGQGEALAAPCWNSGACSTPALTPIKLF